jgi:hypothetical protein
MTNLQTASEFLSLLDEHDDFTFQTFPDRKSSIASSASLPSVLHGTLDEHRIRLKQLNDAGAGIFVMVNEGDGEIKPGNKTCRTSANVVRVRALFVDLDGSPLDPVLSCELKPDWVVQSSPYRWHAYWRIAGCPLESFRGAQIALAQKFNADRSVNDLPRVMRVPGFIHHKAEPFTSRLWLPPNYQQISEMNHE